MSSRRRRLAEDLADTRSNAPDGPWEPVMEAWTAGAECGLLCTGDPVLAQTAFRRLQDHADVVVGHPDRWESDQLAMIDRSRVLALAETMGEVPAPLLRRCTAILRFDPPGTRSARTSPDQPELTGTALEGEDLLTAVVMMLDRAGCQDHGLDVAASRLAISLSARIGSGRAADLVARTVAAPRAACTSATEDPGIPPLQEPTGADDPSDTEPPPGPDSPSVSAVSGPAPDDPSDGPDADDGPAQDGPTPEDRTDTGSPPDAPTPETTAGESSDAREVGSEDEPQAGDHAPACHDGPLEGIDGAQHDARAESTTAEGPTARETTAQETTAQETTAQEGGPPGGAASLDDPGALELALPDAPEGQLDGPTGIHATLRAPLSQRRALARRHLDGRDGSRSRSQHRGAAFREVAVERAGGIIAAAPTLRRAARRRGLGRRSEGDMPGRRPLESSSRQDPAESQAQTPTASAADVVVRREDLRGVLRRRRGGTHSVIVIDGSSSLRSSGLSQASRTLSDLVSSTASRRGTVSVVLAAGSVPRLLVGRTTSAARARLSLDRVPAGGGTPLVPALDLAAELLEAEEPQHRRVLLVTDGLPTVGRGGRHLPPRTAQEELRLRIGELVVDGTDVAVIPVGARSTSTRQAMDSLRRAGARVL